MSETTEFPRSFEAALDELEGLVGRMETGELPLQESLAVYSAVPSCSRIARLR